MKKPKKPSRKFVLVEVETTLSNADLKNVVHRELGSCVDVIQVMVNAAKKEKSK